MNYCTGLLIRGNHATTINSRIRGTTSKFILATLAFRLEPEVVQTFKPVLDAIDDLQHLEQLFNAAMQVETPEDFTKALDENSE